jgi:hypothetical protein
MKLTKKKKKRRKEGRKEEGVKWNERKSRVT